MINQIRRPLAAMSAFGVSQMHRQNPYIVAWWSAAFPGFGHYLLNQYFRATILTLFEVFTNTVAHINESIVYSFCGDIETAKAILRPDWAFGYLVIYLFAIWDSFRSTRMQNKMCQLAELENEPLRATFFSTLEFQYLEQKNPNIAAWYSLLFPGLGQLYNQRFGLAFYAIFWWWLYSILSHAYISIFYLLTGNLRQAASVLDIHWLLFMPSVMGGAVYHASITAVGHNRLFRLEQRQYLTDRYGDPEVRIFDKGGMQVADSGSF